MMLLMNKISYSKTAENVKVIQFKYLTKSAKLPVVSPQTSICFSMISHNRYQTPLTSSYTILIEILSAIGNRITLIMKNSFTTVCDFVYWKIITKSPQNLLLNLHKSPLSQNHSSYFFSTFFISLFLD
jgi:hypothetical protein